MAANELRLSGLVLAAALVALMLSGTHHSLTFGNTYSVAVAIRLPSATSSQCPVGYVKDAEGNCIDSCTVRNCGTNARCLKSQAGWADCVCDRGFKLLPDASCAQLCTAEDCGENGYCEEDQGISSCHCNPGFEKTADGCVDTCVLQACGENGQCVKDAEGAASCVCDPFFGLAPDGKTCTDTCVLQECGENGQCVQDENGAASCVCDPGFTLRDDGKSCHDNSPNGPPDFVDLPPAAVNRPCPAGEERDADGNCVDVCVVRNCGPNANCLKSEGGWANCVCERGLKLLPNASCSHSCSIMDCGENAYCEKEESLAVCHCNWGYAMTEDGCVDTCILKACSAHGHCVKDALGWASCVCDVGFTLQKDGRTCKDNCIIKNCDILTSYYCMKYPNGNADCVCRSGYTKLYGECVGPATCGNCPAGATCTLVSSTLKAPYCYCPGGYGMTSTGCVRGYAPTVSSASFTFYNLPKYDLTPNTYTLRVIYNGCTNLPTSIGYYVQSYWRVDRAPGGIGNCKTIYVYRYPNCAGSPIAQLPYLSLGSITAQGVP
ncbi:unnamed protein product [Closterium sp. NIES-64]|nr:unnamed protein product [Closterium sp. NIES-64]